ncbi:protein ENHANCED DISEASE RESISTANCE 2 [Physcomitrium patens]|uniref:Protein ENHANCED DISEASE RESISTANCE 2 C-terminal domain-containing protein n=1 Tax=Physcomitrium patens TaxID=3218 RepID=A0A2K1JRL1_PHYPA|nr:protein ENHANCED DISEASE RESISTANCE 2-like [Physcomitrium patens]PNR44163.1 hypothetical protein PHYPA_016547 [Physcomitrium patens]|eukprot:XP_024391256.1 protein ENHANCED DISEASE RESISTANCE 2-like [Physcomitrella patens]
MRGSGGCQRMHAVVPVREEVLTKENMERGASKKDVREEDWVKEVLEGGSLRNVELEDGEHGWASPQASLFMVRGLNYFQKKLKTPCSEALLEPLGVDWLRSNGKLDHVLAHPGNRVMQAFEKASGEARKTSFIVAINLQVPGKDHHSAVFYFVTDEPIVEGSLLYRFIHQDDAFRNSRFKLINRIVKGPWIVKTAVGNHAACLLGRALTCRYMRGHNYLEIDVDIGSSTVANAILHLALGYVTTVSVDMAFLIEAQSDEELPEKLLGAVRIAQIEMETASYLEVHHENSALPSHHQPVYQSSLYWRKFGKSLSKFGGHGSKNGRVDAEDVGEK